jgi:hypothetical protein
MSRLSRKSIEVKIAIKHKTLVKEKMDRARNLTIKQISTPRLLMIILSTRSEIWAAPLY